MGLIGQYEGVLRRHPILALATLVYLAFVGWVTLGPQPLDDSNNGWLLEALAFFARHDASAWITYGRVEFVANIAMFVPIGLLLLLLFGRRLWWLAMLIGFALTCAIEFTQLFLPTRFTDVRDIVANTTGTVIAVLIALAFRWARGRSVTRHV